MAGSGDAVTGEPVRANEPAPSEWARWERALSYLPLVFFSGREVVELLRGERPDWFLAAVLAIWAWIIAGRLWRRWRPDSAPSRGWVVVDDAGIRRSNGVTWIAFEDLAQVDRQEQWPNLALYRRSGNTVRLFPWKAGADDDAASVVAAAVLERAAAAGVVTTQQPVAMWRPSAYEVDWDRAIVPPSRWSRFRSSSSTDRSN